MKPASLRLALLLSVALNLGVIATVALDRLRTPSSNRDKDHALLEHLLRSSGWNSGEVIVAEDDAEDENERMPLEPVMLFPHDLILTRPAGVAAGSSSPARPRCSARTACGSFATGCRT